MAQKAEHQEKKTSEVVVLSSDERELEAEKLIKKYSAIAIGAGLIPVPLLDIAALGGVQVKQVHDLGKLYGRELSDDASKTAVLAAVSTLTAHPVARVGASLLKIVPVLGSAISTLAFPAYAAASTYAIGKLYHRHFTEGGTILDFDAKNARHSYNKLVKRFKSPNEEEVAPA